MAPAPLSGRIQLQDGGRPSFPRSRNSKNILVPALKKAKEDANVKAPIVGDRLVVNGRRYTFNKIPMQWRKDEVQQQDAPAQEIQDPEDPTTLEIEPSQETSEIT